MEKLDNQKVVRKRLFEPKENYLTRVEQVIYNLYVKKGFLPKEISLRRGTTQEAVHKVIRRLKKKGFIDSRSAPLKNYPTRGVNLLQGLDNYYRLHAEHMIVKIIYTSEKYLNAMKMGNVISYNGVKIKFHSNSLEIYSYNGLSFTGRTIEEAVKKSLDYWFSYLNWIESRYNIILIKEGKHNIRIVNSHYAFVNNMIGKAIESKVGRLTIRSEDGKVSLITDNSFGNKEIESIHSDKGESHMIRIQKHLGDLIDNDPPTNTELHLMIKTLKNKVNRFEKTVSFRKLREITIKESNTLNIGRLSTVVKKETTQFHNNSGRQSKIISVLKYTI